MGAGRDMVFPYGVFYVRKTKRNRKAPRKEPPTNQQVFRNFVHPVHGDVKAGQRVVHKPSGVAGVVLSTREDKICWRPDTRIKPGGRCMG